LCDYIAADKSGVSRQPKNDLQVIVRSNRAEPHLFCIPGSYSDISGFFNLARHLPQEQPVVAFRLPEPTSPTGAHRLEEVAARYVREAIEIQRDGPYHLAGVCVGGLIAYEMAVQLADRGKTVGLLALLDCYNQAYASAFSLPRKLSYRVRLLTERMHYQARQLRTAGVPHALGHLRDKMAIFSETAASRAGEWMHRLLPHAGITPPKRLMSSRVAIRRAMYDYHPPRWSGPLQLFRVEEPRVDAYDYPDMGWQGFIDGAITIHDVPGSHRTFLGEPDVRFVAERLRSCLEQVKTGTHSGAPPTSSDRRTLRG
jgi:thioesterase domain-containing protein